MLNLIGAMIAVGSFSLYVHLQKGYEGQRPMALQIGGGLLISAGMLMTFFA